MILGIGIDICSVARMDRELRSPERGFLRSVFDAGEIDEASPSALAARFAAKEAVVKALARGGARGSFWRDVVLAGDGPSPEVVLGGRLGEAAAALGVARVSVALAEGGDYGAAAAVAENAEGGPGGRRTSNQKEHGGRR